MSHEPFYPNSARFLKLSLGDRICAGISTRNGGVSAEPYKSFNLGYHVGDDQEHVLENRNKLADHLIFPLQEWVCAEQVHGSHIERVSFQQRGKGSKDMKTAIPGTDGIYTYEPDVLLALGYADCVPLYFFASNHPIVGIAHAGWRGTTENIAGKMIDRWVREEGIPINEIHVVIGPSIGPCCYEVDQKVIQAVKNVLGEQSDEVYEPSREGHFRLDLKKCNGKLCEKAGISMNHIECSSYCTGCHTDIFYSHRVEGGPTGRMLAYIGIQGE